MMKKLNLAIICLFGVSSIAFSNVKIFNNSSATITGDGTSYGYNLSVAPLLASSKKNILLPQDQFNNAMDLGKPIWSISTRKLPVTADDCDAADVMTCDEESRYCYNHCLVSSPPDVLAFDEKANKIYFLVGTPDIGTGGGEAFLFVGDINKNEVKLLHAEEDQEKGSLSPSGRYFLMHGYSVLKMYDTLENNNRVVLNTSDNFYNANEDIRHKLTVKKWLSDTQFVYLDIARHFVRPIPDGGEPLYSAKEVTYDLINRKILGQRDISKEEVADSERIS